MSLRMFHMIFVLLAIVGAGSVRTVGRLELHPDRRCRDSDLGNRPVFSVDSA